MRYLITVAFLCSAAFSTAQQKPATVRFTERDLIDAIESDQFRTVDIGLGPVVIINSSVTIVKDGSAFGMIPGQRIKTVLKEAVIDGVKSEGPESIPMIFQRIHFTKAFTLRVNDVVLLDSCVFDDNAQIDVSGLTVTHCTFNSTFNLNSKQDLNVSDNTITSSRISALASSGGYLSGDYWNAWVDSARNTDDAWFNSSYNQFIRTDANLRLTGNNFTNDKNRTALTLALYGNFAEIRDNKGYVSLIFGPSIINGSLIFRHNDLEGKIVLDQLVLSSTSTIEWASIADRLAVVETKTWNPDYKHIPSQFLLGVPDSPWPVEISRFYSGRKSDNLLNTDLYNKLAYSYKKVRETYITRGNLEDANAVFVASKDLDGRRLLAQSDSTRSFKTKINYALNRVMKLYTDHGTDPGKAIVISLWIIVLFAVFYFFFPSDWDVASKSKLIENFRAMNRKRGKENIKPAVRLIMGFITSMFNALTLSLNAFTTLGFGNIPTHGIARYVCIFQGFLGWFLLSIFTVAMINQVSG